MSNGDDIKHRIDPSRIRDPKDYDIEYAAPPPTRATKVAKKGDYHGYFRNDMEGIEARVIAARTRTEQEGEDLRKSVADNNTGCLKTKDNFNGGRDDLVSCIRMGFLEHIPGEGKVISYKPIASGGQYVVYIAEVDEDKLNFSAWAEIYVNFRAFELMKPKEGEGVQGVLDDKKKYLGEASKEIADLVKEEIEQIQKERVGTITRDEIRSSAEEIQAQAEERVAPKLRDKLYEAWGRRRMFPTKKCAVKVSKKGRREDKSIGKELDTVGFYSKNSVFVPIAGRSINERTYMVMDLIEDPLTIKQIKEETTIYDKMKILRQILDFIGDYWAVKAVHRDFKPSNVAITRWKKLREDGSEDWEHLARVLDFGITRMYKEDLTYDTSKTMTRPGDVVGTPDYFSPEHVLSPNKVDWRTDVFCSGATMYTWLIGLSPNPTDPTGDFELDRAKKKLNAGADPEEKYKPVDPVNAIDTKNKYNALWLHKPKRKRYQRVLDFIKDPFKLRERYRIWHDYDNFCTYIAKLMQHYPSQRYERIEDAKRDLDAIIKHEDPPILTAELAKQVKIIEVEKRGKKKKKKKKLPRVKHSEYRATVFSKFDPVYEKAINDPIIQRYLGRQKIKHWALTMGAVAVTSVGSVFAAEYLPKFLEWLQNLTTK